MIMYGDYKWFKEYIDRKDGPIVGGAEYCVK